jgi:flagellar basal body-associated protein FliL
MPKKDKYNFDVNYNFIPPTRKRFIGIDYEVKEKKRKERLEKYKGWSKTEIIKDILANNND